MRFSLGKEGTFVFNAQFARNLFGRICIKQTYSFFLHIFSIDSSKSLSKFHVDWPWNITMKKKANKNTPHNLCNLNSKAFLCNFIGKHTVIWMEKQGESKQFILIQKKKEKFTFFLKSSIVCEQCKECINLYRTHQKKKKKKRKEYKQLLV